MRAGHVGYFVPRVLGGSLSWKGSDLSGQLIPYLYQVCNLWYSHTSACAEASTEALGGAAWIGLCCIISSGLWSFSMITCLPYV